MRCWIEINAFMNLITIIITLGVGFYYRALVFMILFNWFVVTDFNLEPIGYWMSFALILIIGALSARGKDVSLLHYAKNRMGDEERTFVNLGNVLGVFLTLNIVLFIGWIIHLNI